MYPARVRRGMRTTSLRLREETFDAMHEHLDGADENQSEFLRRSVEEHLEGVVTEAEHEELRAECDRLQELVDRMDSDRERLQAANERLSERVESQAKAVEASEDRHEQAMAEYERLQDEYAEECAEYEDEIEHLETQVERLQKQNTLILEQRENTKQLVKQHRELAVFAEERRKVVSGEKPKPNVFTRGKRWLFGYHPEGVEVESTTE